MSEQLGSVEVYCDAPSYLVVQACRGLGIHSPEDVRWVRMSTYRPQRRRGPAAFLRRLFGLDNRGAATCTCGAPLPDPRGVVAGVAVFGGTAYCVGQCPRCRTVFWDVV